MPRLDTGNVYAALRDCSAAGFRPANFFDLGTAFKLLDYWKYGQSLYQTVAPSLRVSSCVEAAFERTATFGQAWKRSPKSSANVNAHFHFLISLTFPLTSS